MSTAPKYFVTYCVMDSEAGANPFGHSCLLFSKQEDEGGPIQVIDSIGYYSQPSTSIAVIDILKKILCIKFDLQDTHGVLIQEKMREINGPGLKGISFELTQTQYKKFHAAYKKIMAEEAAAIKEYNEQLGKDSNGPKRLAEELERHLKSLLTLELPTQDTDTDKAVDAVIGCIKSENPDNHIKALQNKIQQLETKLGSKAPKSRLTHFQISGVIDSTGSYSCKQRAFDLLLEQGVIDQQRIALIYGSNAFPRSSEGLTPIHCISMGKISKREPRPGTVYFNHVWPNHSSDTPNETELFFATPLALSINPSACDPEGVQRAQEPSYEESQTNEHLPKKDWPEYYALVKAIIARIRQVEILLCNKKDSSTDSQLTAQLDKQLNALQLLRQGFKYDKNSSLERLNDQISKANLILNKATIATYSDEYINSFMLRAYSSMSAKNTLFGLLTVILCTGVLIVPAANIIVTLATATCMSLATVITTKNAHHFFSDERAFRKCKASMDIPDELNHSPALATI